MRHARKRALTFPALQTIVSYNCFNCNSPNGGLISRTLGPDPPSLPPPHGCLGPDREGSTAARFMIRASIESVPPIRRIKNREVDHLRKFVAAMRRAMPGRDDADLYWGLHFALAMAHHTIREKERLTKLSEGQCDLNDVQAIVDRVVSVSVMALTGGETPAKKVSTRPPAPHGRLTRQDL